MSKKKGRIYRCAVCDSIFEPWRATQETCSKSCASTGKRNNSYEHGHLIGKKPTRTLSTWYGMKSRVNNPDDYHKKYYGHVKLCERWNKFENFLNDMGECPGDGYSIDRINTYGNYEPSNCRWATHEEQMNNTTFNKRISLEGVTLTQAQWGKKLGISGAVIHKRLKRGWSVKEALTKPLNPPQKHTRYLTYRGVTKTIKEFSEEYGLLRETISYRLDKLGWSVDKALNHPKR